MKKLSLFLALLAATMVAQAETIEHIYHFSQPIVSAQGEYQQIGFQGCLPSGMVGEPTFPWQSISLMLPQGQEAVSVEVEFFDFVEMETNSKVQNQWAYLENEQHKRRRCYKKNL